MTGGASQTAFFDAHIAAAAGTAQQIPDRFKFFSLSVCHFFLLIETARIRRNCQSSASLSAAVFFLLYHKLRGCRRRLVRMRRKAENRGDLFGRISHAGRRRSLFSLRPCILSAAVLDYIGIESKERNNDKRLMEGPPVLR